MDHLALAVSDQDRSRRFYERYLGFTAEHEQRSDGALMMHSGDFSLALGVTTEQISLPAFLHFGKGASNPDECVPSTTGWSRTASRSSGCGTSPTT